LFDFSTDKIEFFSVLNHHQQQKKQFNLYFYLKEDTKYFRFS